MGRHFTMSSFQNENEDDPALYNFLAEPKWFRRRGLSVNPLNGVIGSVVLTKNETSTGDAVLDDDKLLAEGVEIRSLAIFPFDDACAFPTGVVPLNIFVMKYRQLVNDAFDQKDKLFGVVCSDGQGGFCEVGTAVQIVERQLQPDGRQLLFNVCRSRFRIRKILQEEPYMICEVEYPIVDTDVIAVAAQELPQILCNLEKEVFQLLRDVMKLSSKLAKSNAEMEGLGGVEGGEVEGVGADGEGGDFEIQLSKAIQDLSPLSHPFRTQVASDFSFAICDLLGTSPKVRQLLLESTSLEGRLRLLQRLLVNDSYTHRFNLREKKHHTHSPHLNYHTHFKRNNEKLT